MKNEEKHRDATLRQNEHDSLTPIQQLEKINKTAGLGVGSKKERIKLKELIDNGKGEETFKKIKVDIIEEKNKKEKKKNKKK